MKKDLHYIFLLILLMLSFSVFVNLSNTNKYDIESSEKYLINNDNSIEIVEYMDFSCETCKNSHFKTMEIVDKYKEIISFKIKHATLNNENLGISLGLECSNDQNSLKNYLLALKKSDTTNPFHIAKIINLDERKFNTCMNQKEKIKLVLDETKELLNLNILDVPSIFINGKHTTLNNIEKEINKIIKN